MGGTSYNFNTRSLKTESLKTKDASGNFTRSADSIFEQNRARTAHKSMIPNKANKAHLRESRDSAAHPYSVPIIVALDVTGSMGDIPEHLVREGLPKMISRIMELGITDPQVLIMAIGDSRCDNNNGVFQLGQFESGDVEMDMWLERIWISKGGGGNGSESYNWPYYYALNHIQTDAWDKRQQKGFIFTIGDDHCQLSLSRHELAEYMGEIVASPEESDTKSVIEMLRERWNVYHIDLGDTGSGYGNGTTKESWSKILGEESVFKCGRRDYDGIGNKIAETVANGVPDRYKRGQTTEDRAKKDDKKEDTIIL